jgi:hypothetical protein
MLRRLPLRASFAERRGDCDRGQSADQELCDHLFPHLFAHEPTPRSLFRNMI